MDCPQCGGGKHIRTPSGWTPCTCYWRELILANIPALLRQDEDSLPPDIIKLDPWSIEVDRFEIGEGLNWDAFRWRTWWALAHAIFNAHATTSPKMPRAIVLETFRLRDIHFGEDAEFKTLRTFLDYDFVLIVGGTEPTFMRGPIAELTESLIRLRRLHGRPTWGYKLPASMNYLPDFSGTAAAPREPKTPPSQSQANVHTLPTQPATPAAQPALPAATTPEPLVHPRAPGPVRTPAPAGQPRSRRKGPPEPRDW